jgi:threonine synthase
MMGEGNTPLVESVHLGPSLGIRLFFKLEMCNPSGSYKDRFIAAQVREFQKIKVNACVATSSGNTGSALAAFCARYGILCAIFVNEFAPAGKLLQMQAHGARVFRVRDFITSPAVTQNVFARLSGMAQEHSVPLVVSAYRYCPDGMRGVESIALELSEQCGNRLDHVFVPVGGGGLFTAVCRGFSRSPVHPKVHAVQPEGCATVVSAFREKREEIRPVESTTRISGLAVPYDIDAGSALRALRKSGGEAIGIPDGEVFAAQKRMLREEGIWCEPAGAAALAGCLKACRQGRIEAGESVVCLVTGHGFKDPDSLSEAAQENVISLISEEGINADLLEVRG